MPDIFVKALVLKKFGCDMFNPDSILYERNSVVSKIAVALSRTSNKALLFKCKPRKQHALIQLFLFSSS